MNEYEKRLTANVNRYALQRQGWLRYFINLAILMGLLVVTAFQVLIAYYLAEEGIH